MVHALVTCTNPYSDVDKKAAKPRAPPNRSALDAALEAVEPFDCMQAMLRAMRDPDARTEAKKGISVKMRSFEAKIKE